MAKQVGGDAIETRPGCSPTTFGSLHLDQDQAHCNVILVQLLHFDNDDDWLWCDDDDDDGGGGGGGDLDSTLQCRLDAVIAAER